MEINLEFFYKDGNQMVDIRDSAGRGVAYPVKNAQGVGRSLELYLDEYYPEIDENFVCYTACDCMTRDAEDCICQIVNRPVYELSTCPLDELTDTPLEEAELFGLFVLDYGKRVPDEIREALTEQYPDIRFYDIQHHSEDIADWVQVKDYVFVNYCTTVVSKTTIPTSRLIEPDEWGYTGETKTMEQYFKGEKS